jgi:hypothetical protein
MFVEIYDAGSRVSIINNSWSFMPIPKEDPPTEDFLIQM